MRDYIQRQPAPASSPQGAAIQLQQNPNAAVPPPTLSVPWTDTQTTDYEQTSGYGYGTKRAGNVPLNRVDYVVLHSTGGASVVGNLNAHMEVGQDGQIYMAAPLDKQAWHAGHAWQNQKGHRLNQYHDMNTRSLGIEFVNEPVTLTNQPAATDKAGMTNLRTEIQGLNLSPGLKARLIAMNDKTLHDTMVGTGWVIYPDITPDQKRSAYELQQNLLQDYPTADFVGHEEVAPKKLGEGENIREFLDTMEVYNRNLASLQAYDPSYWLTLGPGKETLLQQAQREMTTDQFYAEFYTIASLAARITSSMASKDSISTKDLIPFFHPDQSADMVGMTRILMKYQQHLFKKVFLERVVLVDVKVITADDQYGDEEEVYVESGSYNSGYTALKTGQLHTFRIPISDLWWQYLLSKSVTIKVMEDDSPFSNDTLFTLGWSNPLDNTNGVSAANANYSASAHY